ncbi:MAG: hypothetical protein KBA64_05715 [Armatimonadetes bacterium]|jgi:hypothetical protein|nr:hypothetical protein [Armatimonadota bacterium]MDI9602580.1 hypothetical protein [Acidobacteriota bacterium]
MNRTCALVITLAAVLVVGAAAQERPMVQLRYTPPAEGVRSYAASIEGSAEVAMLNIGAVPVYADLNFDIAYGPLSDGVIEEKLTYTRVQAMVMGQTVSSGYVNRPVTMRRGVGGQWLPESEAYPPPELLSADLFTLFGQVPRMLRLPDHPVGVGDEWGVERETLPRLFQVGDLPDMSGAQPAPQSPLEAEEEGLDPEVGAEEAVEAAEGAEDAPPAEGDEADAEAVPPAEAEGVVEDAEGAENDAAAEPQQQEQPDAADDPLPPSSTFLSQRNRLDNLQDHNGRMAAIIRSEMAVDMVRETFFTGVVVDGRIIANMEQAIYVDTGEMIVANVELAAEFQIPSPFGQVSIAIPRVFARYGDPAEIAPLVGDQQPRNPAGGRGGRAGVGGGRAGVR